MWTLDSKKICTTKYLLKLHLRATKHDANNVDAGEEELDEITGVNLLPNVVFKIIWWTASIVEASSLITNIFINNLLVALILFSWQRSGVAHFDQFSTSLGGRCIKKFTYNRSPFQDLTKKFSLECKKVLVHDDMHSIGLPWRSQSIQTFWH